MTKYRVILAKRGCCSYAIAAESLQALTGCRKEEAEDLVRCLPACICEDLGAVQARYLARALNECGMVSEVYDSHDHPAQTWTHETVFALDGGLLKNVRSILSGIHLRMHQSI
ncbi:MAG: hypothetical protein LKE48_09765 [Solobacterium sp.]|jgi:hypothetical protein|nr:hypothetical protein [Solobacterium sp.]